MDSRLSRVESALTRRNPCAVSMPQRKVCWKRQHHVQQLQGMIPALGEQQIFMTRAACGASQFIMSVCKRLASWLIS